MNGDLTTTGTGKSITLDGPSVVLANGSDLNTSAGNGDVVFASDGLSLAGDNILNAGTGSVAFRPTVSSKNIDLRAGSGGVADVNYDAGFSGLTASAVTVGGSTHTGNITIATGGMTPTYGLAVQNGGTGAITVAGSYNSSASNKSLTLSSGSGGILLNDATINLGSGAFAATGMTTLGADVVVSASGGITFNNTIDGAKSLTLAAGTGNVTTSGAIGATTALSGLGVSGANITMANLGATSAGVSGLTNLNATTDITLTGTTYHANQQTYTAGTKFNLDAGSSSAFTASGDAISFNAGTLKLASGSSIGITSNNGDVTLGTVQGTDSESVTVNAGTGTTTVGSIGTGINTVALTGSTVTIGGASSAASVNLTGSRLFVNGDIATTQTQSYRGSESIMIAGNLSVSGDGMITLNGSGRTTTLRANVNTTGGNITINDSILLEVDAQLSTGTGSGNIQITGNINNAKSLVLKAGGGDIQLEGVVGNSSPLATLAVSGNNISIMKGINTDGNQSYQSVQKITMDNGVVISSSSPGSSISLVSSGDIKLASLNSAGNADISATGSIYSARSEATPGNAVNDIVTAGNLSLKATNGTVGLQNSPVAFKVGGTLGLTVGKAINNNASAAYLNGTTGKFILTDAPSDSFVYNSAEYAIVGSDLLKRNINKEEDLNLNFDPIGFLSNDMVGGSSSSQRESEQEEGKVNRSLTAKDKSREALIPFPKENDKENNIIKIMRSWAQTNVSRVSKIMF